MMRYSLTCTQLTTLYKQLVTKTIVTYISTNRTYKYTILPYKYHLANNNYIIIQSPRAV